MRDIDRYGLEYQQLPFEKEMARFRKRMIKEKALCYPHDRILEIGCGLDPLFTTFQDFGRLTVVEPCLHFYQNCDRLVNKQGFQHKVTLIKGCIQDYVDSLQTMRFDLILISSLLHEIETPSDLLKAAHDIACADTVVHINVPNARSFHRLLAVQAGLIQSEYEPSATQIRLQQHHTFDLQSLSALCLENGFSIVDQDSYFIKPFTHAQMDTLIKEGVIENKVLEGFYKMTRYMPELGAEIYVNLKRV